MLLKPGSGAHLWPQTSSTRQQLRQAQRGRSRQKNHSSGAPTSSWRGRLSNRSRQTCGAWSCRAGNATARTIWGKPQLSAMAKVASRATRRPTQCHSSSVWKYLRGSSRAASSVARPSSCCWRLSARALFWRWAFLGRRRLLLLLLAGACRGGARRALMHHAKPDSTAQERPPNSSFWTGNTRRVHALAAGASWSIVCAITSQVSPCSPKLEQLSLGSG